MSDDLDDAYSAIEKLDASHQVDAFDCGKEPLNQFLKRHALINRKAGGALTYVVCRERRRAVGYYSLAYGSVDHAEAAARLSKGLARHPIPVMLLARLAIDKGEQGRGLGRALLKDALRRSARAADIAGMRALIVHAKDEEARAWYEALNFEPSPTDPFHLFLLVKDLRALIGA